MLSVKRHHYCCIRTKEQHKENLFSPVAYKVTDEVRGSRLGIYKADSCRIEIVHWVAESAWPFEIVDDPGFQCLMKTRWPNHYLPDPCTVSRDVQNTFTHVCQRLAERLQVSVSII